MNVLLPGWQLNPNLLDPVHSPAAVSIAAGFELTHKKGSSF